MSSVAPNAHALLFVSVLIVVALVYSCDTGPTAVDAQPDGDAGSGSDCNCVVPDTIGVEVINEPTVHAATVPNDSLFELVLSGKLTQHLSTVAISGTNDSGFPIALEPGHVFITRVACQRPSFETSSRGRFIIENASGARLLTFVPPLIAQAQSGGSGSYQTIVTAPFSESFNAPIYVNNVGSQAGLKLLGDYHSQASFECDFTYYVYDPDVG